MPSDTTEQAIPSPRAPSFVDALAPIIVLVGLLALTIALFGLEATDGPLQVALLTSTAFAGLVALKNGYTAATLREAAVGGVSSAMGAIFILLAVGALIGTWNMAGTIPTVVSYGIALLRPGIFYLALALICAVVGMVTGSSWTTAGTLGVAFVGMAPILGMSTAIAAGAVVSGAYVGDKMTPLSETTILVPGLVARRGLAPRMLSRTVEDTGTVTSPLVPWNSCGAYMTGVLGVSTMQYLPYAFFNMLNPLVALAYAFTGFRIEHLGPTEAGGPNVVGGVESSAELPLLAPGGESHVE